MSERWTHLVATLRAPSPFHQSLEPERISLALTEVLGEAPALVHRFHPQGASFICHGPSRRLALHTWPEHGVATLDLHLAAPPSVADRLCRSLEAAQGWARSECETYPRDIGDTN